MEETKKEHLHIVLFLNQRKWIVNVSTIITNANLIKNETTNQMVVYKGIFRFSVKSSPLYYSVKNFLVQTIIQIGNLEYEKTILWD